MKKTVTQAPKSNKKKRLIITAAIVAAVLAALVIAWIIYVNNYYHADTEALAILTESHENYTVEETKNRIVLRPTASQATSQTVAQKGFIFYPGGKVQYEAYLPLLARLADEGILCVLVHMPANLAILNGTAADGIQEEFPEITEWYIGGHSLGGVMATHYMEKHADDFAGLVLLGAYADKDLSGTKLKVLSLYGSEDGVLNREAYEENRSHLPEKAEEFVLEGGCHSYFGNYGLQDGDGTPTITCEEQQEQTANHILLWMKKK